jgi:RimJ/RimL family protein N-acetyltransferase
MARFPEWDGRTIIDTERLLLRSFREADLPHFAALHTDGEVMQFIGGAPLDRAVTDGIAAAAQHGFDTKGIGMIAVERRSDGAFVGMCGVSIEPWFPDLEVGWRLARQYWGEGYASEAAAAWLGYGFETLGAPRILAVADAPNRRSIAVMERIGMSFDHSANLADENGTFAAVIYSLTAERWRERRTAQP